jgi:hypothetical protein
MMASDNEDQLRQTADELMAGAALRRLALLLRHSARSMRYI